MPPPTVAATLVRDVPRNSTGLTAHFGGMALPVAVSWNMEWEPRHPVELESVAGGVVTVRYTDDEVQGLDRDSLRLDAAPAKDLDALFEPVPVQGSVADRNQLTALILAATPLRLAIASMPD